MRRNVVWLFQIEFRIFFEIFRMNLIFKKICFVCDGFKKYFGTRYSDRCAMFIDYLTNPLCDFMIHLISIHFDFLKWKKKIPFRQYPPSRPKRIWMKWKKRNICISVYLYIYISILSSNIQNIKYKLLKVMLKHDQNIC